jgi:hypothetical protein
MGRFAQEAPAQGLAVPNFEGGRTGRESPPEAIARVVDMPRTPKRRVFAVAMSLNECADALRAYSEPDAVFKALCCF